jgi:ubiquinone/menaquinone biosynthesis C-methylase UbiE/ribosomal protein S27E
LRCPSCHESRLALAEDDTALVCAACGSSYPVDGEGGFASLLSDFTGGEVKADIQAWWGDLYKQLYDGHEEGVDQATLDARLADVEDLFRKREHLCTEEMPLDDLAGKSVLEIGPGAGAHSSIFLRHGAELTAADITIERAAATMRKFTILKPGHGQAYQADAENLPFADNSFDIVYSNGVLHHSDDTVRCIAEVNRVLKPGGKAVLMLYARHSSVYWCNVLPRALLTGEFFRWPEANWVGRLTEGKPKFGDVRNPVTRVYSAREIRELMGDFEMKSLRKSSFQFDNVCIPRMTQIRDWLLAKTGTPPHPGGVPVYGKDFLPETKLELAIGRAFGFCWNIVAEKRP